MSHHQNRLRPTISVRDSYAAAPVVDELAELETAGTFQPVPPPKKKIAKKPAPKKARR